ncbi:MAG: hypothetical protein AB1635_20985, partial [Acidobacteriota bacterium]
MTVSGWRQGRQSSAGLWRTRRLGRSSALVLTLVALVVVVPRAQAPAAAAERALLAGRFDEVVAAAASQPGDETLAVFAARAEVARGQYERAEERLRPLAAEHPSGDAALELGLLQQYLGRRSEARRTLALVLLGQPDRPTVRDHARAAAAARAL